jgi:hypothetical protein
MAEQLKVSFGDDLKGGMSLLFNAAVIEHANIGTRMGSK